ncbi:pentapeptide repeat-containing protein [Nocardiopsis sp. NPDC058631]|uniref:pentapeptide repeat-containing protein n=1 Tax=Nocardiopsis sp. NPDC058631 TaxID=3346566 RepID=UPI00364AF8A3
MRSPTPRQWTGIALAVVVLPALTATAWPLLVFLWSLLPDTLPLGRILLGAALTVALVVAVVLIRAETRRRTSFRLWWLILAAWAVAIGSVAGMVVLIWLVLGTPGLDLPRDLSPRALDAIATRAFAVVAGLGGVALLVIHYRRQRTTEADAERAERAAELEVTKLFNERFTAAYTELGSEHAAVRLGAVHALAHLADDAPSEEEVQMVIDVLCAYLRVPYTPRPDEPSGQPTQPVLPAASPTTAVDLSRLSSTEHDETQREKQQAAQEEHRRQVLEFESFQQVRHTIIRVIGNHLREPTRWRGKNYDFTGVVFDGGDFSHACFSGGTVRFDHARFPGGDVRFFNTQFVGADVIFQYVRFSGGRVYFTGSNFSSGTVTFRAARFSDGLVHFSHVKFSGANVHFYAEFSGGGVYFSEACFTGDAVDFRLAEFSGAEVVFATSELGGAATGDCPIGLVKSAAAVKRVRLPQAWLEAGDRDDLAPPLKGHAW